MDKNIFDQKFDLETEIQKKKAIGLIHRAYLTQLQNARIYTASTKTKSEVRGGGRKPWRQKGTGNARAGSIRSPLWAGGGVIFGPKPRLVSKKINKKEKQLALSSAFSFKSSQIFSHPEKFLLDELDLFDKMVKTKTLMEFLSRLGINLNEKTLLILPSVSISKKIWLASRNLKNLEITTMSCLNVCQLLHTNQIIEIYNE